MTSTPTPEPGERCAYIYSDGSTCDRFETDLTTHSIVGHGFVPAPSTPGEGDGRPDTAALRYMAKVTRGRVNNRVDWERTLLDAADWIDTQPPASPADDVPDADAVAFQNGYQIGVRVGSEHHGPCRGLPPASPVPPTRPANYDHTRAAESEAIAKATYALGDHLHPWEDASFDLTESYIGAVCEAMDEFPVPPTPTPCPYIVTGGEGTSYCSLAERSAMHAAAPPSTPADPRPTDPTGSEA